MKKKKFNDIFFCSFLSIRKKIIYGIKFIIAKVYIFFYFRLSASAPNSIIKDLKNFNEEFKLSVIENFESHKFSIKLIKLKENDAFDIKLKAHCKLSNDTKEYEKIITVIENEDGK